MIADQLDAARTQTMSRHSAGQTYEGEYAAKTSNGGLMTDLEDLAKHATQIQDRLDQLRTHLEPILLPGKPLAGRVDDMPELPPAQARTRLVAVTLHAIDDTIEGLLEGIRL